MPSLLSNAAVRKRTTVLVASLLFILIGTGSVYFIVVALKQMAAEFGWSRSVPSIAYGLSYFGAGIGGVFMGLWLDRRGMAIPAFVGASMIGLGAILTSLVTSQWELFLIYGAMFGFFGRSVLFAPLTANITRWFEDKKSLAVGIVVSGQGLAGMLWPQVFHYLILAVGWRQTAFIYGLIALATMLPLALVLSQKAPAPKEEPKSPRSSAGPEPSWHSWSAIQVSLSTASVGCCVAMSLPLTHIVSHVSDLNFDPTRGAEILSLMFACAVISSFFGVGFIAGRYGGLRALFTFSSIQALLLTALIFVDSLPGLYVAAALFGFGYGGILPCYPVIVRELLPSAEAGRRTGLILLCAGMGMAFGSWLGGYIFDLTGSYRLAFLIGVVFNLGNLAIIVSLLIRTSSRPLVS